METIDGTAGLRERVGAELGVSDWYEITQDRINAFAAATDDYEQIHVNPERAAQTPFRTTIAHGLFTLSLGPTFLYEIFAMSHTSLGLNYGFDRVRFITPVPVGSRVRMRTALCCVDGIEDWFACPCAADVRARRAGQAGVRGRVGRRPLRLRRTGMGAGPLGGIRIVELGSIATLSYGPVLASNPSRPGRLHRGPAAPTLAP